MAPAKKVTSPGGTRTPLSPSLTTAIQPGCLVVTIARPLEAASNKTVGTPSPYLVGNAKIFVFWYQTAVSSCQPTQFTNPSFFQSSRVDKLMESGLPWSG